MKQKHWHVSVFDKTSETIKDDTFYTTDTEAYLVFELIDDGFTPDGATITVYNLNGKATINENVEVVEGIARYEIPEEAIGHTGAWRTQVIYTKDNEDYTTGIIKFDVSGHLLDNNKPKLVAISNWNRFIKHTGGLIDNWEQLEEIRQANEQQRELAEKKRHNVFETNENARKTAETIRLANEVDRVNAESIRDSKIVVIEERIESELGEEHIIRSLPNGTKDEIRVDDKKFIKRVSDEVILPIAWFNKSATNTPVGFDLYYATELFTTRGLPIGVIGVNDDLGATRMTIDGVEYTRKQRWGNITDVNQYVTETVLNGLVYLTVPTGQSFDSIYGGKQITLTYQLSEPLLIPLPEQMTPNTIEIARLRELTDKLTNAIISLGGDPSIWN